MNRERSLGLVRHFFRVGSVSLFFSFLIFFTAVVSYGGTHPVDVSERHWAFPYVTQMMKDEVIHGYPDGTFRPDEIIQAGAFVKMSVAFVLEEGDVLPKEDGDHWAMPYYRRGLKLGQFTRHDLMPKGLDRPMTRDRAAGIINALLGDGFPQDTRSYGEILAEIRDVSSRTAYEYPIVRSYAAGILSGYPDQTFRPLGHLTRGEAAVIFSKLHEVKQGEEKAPAPEHIIGSDSAIVTLPEETLVMTLRDYDADPEGWKWALREKLEQVFPAYAEEVYSSFSTFAEKGVGATGQGMRTQYFGPYPSMMERLRTVLRIFILPEGWKNRTWTTKPGEVKDAFF